MKKILEYLNLGLISIYMLVLYVSNKLNHKHCNEKNILIIFQQIFGDSIVFSDSIHYYTQIYKPEDGYRITLLCLPHIKQFMEDVLPPVENIEIVAVDFKRLVKDCTYYRGIVKKYGSDVGTLIVPGTSLSAEFLSIACNANRRVGLVPSISRSKCSPLYYIQKLAYDEIVRPDMDLMMLQRQRVLLNYLGNEEFKSRLPKLLKQPEYVKSDKKYAVVCPGASVSVKCWPAERFVSVIKYIYEQFDFEIYLCGDPLTDEFQMALDKETKLSDHVHDCCGKTNFKEWSSLVQYADFVIGNDSATIHMAAAARRPSVCIAGVYDKYQFFPYGVDVLEPDERLPETVLVDVPCEFCRTKGYLHGWNNPACEKDIKKGKCAHCISAITEEMVIEAIDRAMN